MNQPPLEMGWIANSFTNSAVDLSDVNAFEQAVIEEARKLGRRYYQAAFVWIQEKWLEENARDYAPQRWRSIRQITPLGELELPTRVVRRRDPHSPFFHFKIDRANLPRQLQSRQLPVMGRQIFRHPLSCHTSPPTQITGEPKN